MNKPRVLVTGCNGFLGSALLSHLMKQDWHTYSTARDECFFRYDYPNYFPCDLTEKQELYRLKKRIGKMDIVVHCAGNPKTANTTSTAIESNFNSSINLLETFTPDYFVFLSTSLVWGNYDILNDSEKRGFHEHHPCQPGSVYGWSKYAAEKILELKAKECNSKFSVVRSVAICGQPAFGHIRPRGVVADIVRKLLLLKEDSTGKNLSLFGPQPGARKPFVHVSDCCRFLLSLLENHQKGNDSPLLSIMSNPFPVTIEEIAYTAMKRTGVVRPIEWSKRFVAGDQFWLKVEKTNHHFFTEDDWRYPTSQMSVEQAITEMVGFYKNNPEYLKEEV